MPRTCGQGRLQDPQNSWQDCTTASTSLAIHFISHHWSKAFWGLRRPMEWDASLAQPKRGIQGLPESLCRGALSMQL